jgi:myo-inositol-1(or 4)-monophosphatase
LLYKNQLELGVIYDPIRQDLFTGVRGQGAHLNNRRIRVSATKKINEALIGTGFPCRDKSHLKPYLNMFQAVFPKVSGVRRAGSAALDLAYVAAGKLDGFWEATLKPWDMAAGILMIKEAGGIVTDFHNEHNFLDNGSVIAGNLKIHKELSGLIQESLQE